MVDKRLKQIRKELLGMVKKDKGAEAEEILNRIIGELEPEDTVSDHSYDDTFYFRLLCIIKK
ncbi:MAG: hypothetical protein HFG34_08000 [Eubacterium sp.]|nr:hypothetical protein [Eubacterium sp.]